MKTSLGVRKPRMARGRSLSSSAMASRWGWWSVMSVPSGRYSRVRPLVFSLVGRSHGEWGCANYTGRSVARVNAAWRAMSVP